MIFKAIGALNDKNGSNKSLISKHTYKRETKEMNANQF